MRSIPIVVVWVTVFFGFAYPAYSQSDTLDLAKEDTLDLDLISLDKKEERKPPKVKRKKNEFYGIRSKKSFTKLGKGPRQVIEIFYYLPTYIEPNPYVRNIYWYDLKKKQVSQSYNISEQNTRLLHGPYKKFVGRKLVEEGFYYKGTKHGRWEKYDANFMLVEKAKYYRGWAKESKITYYDANKTKIKEIVPIEHGVKHGTYFMFYDEGQLMVEGQYENNVKVGRWTEYYQYRRRKKSETQYAEDPFNKDFEPIVIREWDEQGKLLYDKEPEASKGLSKF